MSQSVDRSQNQTTEWPSNDRTAKNGKPPAQGIFPTKNHQTNVSNAGRTPHYANTTPAESGRANGTATRTRSVPTRSLSEHSSVVQGNGETGCGKSMAKSAAIGGLGIGFIVGCTLAGNFIFPGIGAVIGFCIGVAVDGIGYGLWHCRQSAVADSPEDRHLNEAQKHGAINSSVTTQRHDESAHSTVTSPKIVALRAAPSPTADPPQANPRSHTLDQSTDADVVTQLPTQEADSAPNVPKSFVLRNLSLSSGSFVDDTGMRAHDLATGLISDLHGPISHDMSRYEMVKQTLEGVLRGVTTSWTNGRTELTNEPPSTDEQLTFMDDCARRLASRCDLWLKYLDASEPDDLDQWTMKLEQAAAADPDFDAQLAAETDRISVNSQDLATFGLSPTSPRAKAAELRISSQFNSVIQAQQKILENAGALSKSDGPAPVLPLNSQTGEVRFNDVLTLVNSLSQDRQQLGQTAASDRSPSISALSNPSGGPIPPRNSIDEDADTNDLLESTSRRSQTPSWDPEDDPTQYQFLNDRSNSRHNSNKSQQTTHAADNEDMNSREFSEFGRRLDDLLKDGTNRDSIGVADVGSRLGSIVEPPSESATNDALTDATE